MERRDALKNIGLSFGAFVATPTALSLLQSCSQEYPKWVPSFFSEEEGIALRRLVDAMLPSVDGLPSATEVNVHVFVDTYIKDVMEFEARKNTRAMFQAVSKGLLDAGGKEAIADLKPSDYTSFLDANLGKSKEEDESLSSEIWEYMSNNNDDASGLADNLKIYSYLTSLRGMAVWGYKSSEVVGETILAYKSIPGEQRGCVDLQETTGGMAWGISS